MWIKQAQHRKSRPSELVYQNTTWWTSSEMFPTTYLPDTTPQAQLPTPQIDPPPYEDSLDSDAELDSEDDDEHEPRAQEPLKLVINTASSVHGCNNLVQTPPPPFTDITNLSTSMLQALNQINAANNTSAASSSGRPRMLKVELQVNCGITVIGDRNVVGGIGLRHKGATATAPGPSTAETAPKIDAASAGAKRKAEDVSMPQTLEFLCLD